MNYANNTIAQAVIGSDREASETPPLADLYEGLMRILSRANSYGWQAERIADAAYGPVPAADTLAGNNQPESLISFVHEIERAMDRIGGNLNRLNGGR